MSEKELIHELNIPRDELVSMIKEIEHLDNYQITEAKLSPKGLRLRYK